MLQQDQADQESEMVSKYGGVSPTQSPFTSFQKNKYNKFVKNLKKKVGGAPNHFSISKINNQSVFKNENKSF